MRCPSRKRSPQEEPPGQIGLLRQEFDQIPVMLTYIEGLVTQAWESRRVMFSGFDGSVVLASPQAIIFPQQRFS